MQTQGPSEPKKETELQKESRFLQEDQKINYIMEMLNSIRFGKLTITKFNNKIVSYNFDGEVKFVIPEFGNKKESSKT